MTRRRFAVVKLIGFCYGHRLLGYAGKCRHLHGHNGVLEVRVESRALSPLGMVVDFEEIKRTVSSWVDAELDHKLILNRRDPLIGALRRAGEPLVLLLGNPTAEAIARHVHSQARRAGLAVASVRLWETPSSYAEYSG